MSKLERQNGVLAGVCGGVAKQMNIDPWIIRGGLIIMCLFTIGLPVLAYIVGVIAIPKADGLPAGDHPGSLGSNGPTVSNTKIVFCPSCGAKNSASNKFCQNCGDALG